MGSQSEPRPGSGPPRPWTVDPLEAEPIELAADTVLVVEADEVRLQDLASALLDEGYEVLTCPGPSALDYSCVGTRTGDCPLARAATVICLDAYLTGGREGKGAGLQLARCYQALGGPLVILADGEEWTGSDPSSRPARIVLPRDCEPATVSAAVRALIDARREA